MPESVTLQQLLTGLAQALTATRTYLERDAAAQDVSGIGASPMAHFAMGEVAFEVPFVVEGFAEREPDLPELPRLRVPTLTERERLSLERGAGEEAARVLQDLLEDAGHLNERLEIVRQEPASAPFVSVSTPVQVQPDNLQALRTGASQSAVRKLEQVLEVYDAQRRALADLRATVTASPTRDVTVRLDPSSFKEAPSAAQHKMTVTFVRDETRRVVVDGQSLTI